MAERRIACCRVASSRRSGGTSRNLISGLRASVPVPEQGTSARTRSYSALGGREQGSWGEFDAFRAQAGFGGGSAKTDCCRGNGLIVLVDAVGGIESVFASPALDHP